MATSQNLINLPNPFKSTTPFRFSTQTAGDFVIDIYNQTGKVVTTLNYTNFNTGVHAIKVNLYDLEPGIYYCSLSNKSGLIAANKMILIK